MKIPVVMPVVHVRVEASGTIKVDLDSVPYGSDRPLWREDLTAVLDRITTELQCPVRVEVVEEADGTTYSDIALPSTEPPGPVQLPTTPSAPLPGVAGRGFRSGESVVIAYVLARQTADDDGAACLRLPSAALASRRVNLVLVGLSSGTVTTLEEQA